ncbi:MAG: rhodanese-like domain-containing protein [Campylobacterota bacterium]|nr:rhodanese-like domain-containing protein [Campylobacterota bacterium]
MLFKFMVSVALGICVQAEVISSSTLLENIQKNVNSINTMQLEKMLEKNPNMRVIDVRTRGDILKQGGYLKVNKRTHISRDKLEFLISDTVKQDEQFVVHCYDGKISLLAANQLKKMGYKNVLHYKDSYKGWKKENKSVSSLDFYAGSMLYRPLEKVAKGMYTSIGATQPATYENSGHNNNLGFIVGDDSVLVWNAGANYLLAKSFHNEIKKITTKPVKYVVLENSQGHAMLGSSYWKEQGAVIVAQEIAKEEIMQLGEKILKRHTRTYKDKVLGTKVVLPDEVFKDTRVFDLGNRIVEAKYFGYAHERSDISLWLPKEEILYAGDLAFNQRMLPIFKITETLKWLEAWEKLAALNAKIVIPGHGDTTDMETVSKYTKGYILHLREKITEVIDNDGGLKEAYEIDQSAYAHLDTFKELSKQNAARLFEQLEFED